MRKELAIKRHLEVYINTLKDAPRDADELGRLLKIKRRQKQEAMERQSTERLVTEIEMLIVVLYVGCRNMRKEEESEEESR